MNDYVRLDVVRSDLLVCDYLSYTRFMGRDLPGLPLVSPSGIHAAWITIERYPHRGWFDLVLFGVSEFVCLAQGDLVILVMAGGSQMRFPLLYPIRGGSLRSNSAAVRIDLLPSLVGLSIERIVFCRIRTMEERSFRFTDDGDLLFRWMVYNIWEESDSLGWN